MPPAPLSTESQPGAVASRSSSSSSHPWTGQGGNALQVRTPLSRSQWSPQKRNSSPHATMRAVWSTSEPKSCAGAVERRPRAFALGIRAAHSERCSHPSKVPQRGTGSTSAAGSRPGRRQIVLQPDARPQSVQPRNQHVLLGARVSCQVHSHTYPGFRQAVSGRFFPFVPGWLKRTWLQALGPSSRRRESNHQGIFRQLCEHPTAPGGSGARHRHPTDQPAGGLQEILPLP